MVEAGKACMMCKMRMATASCTRCGILVCDGCYNAKQQACRTCASRMGSQKR